jgi:hypothetical protein
VFSAASAQAMAQIGVLPFLVLLASAAVSSLVIAALYQYYFANTATGSQIYRALPLLGLTIAALFVAVQFSLPLSLGLLGALSIVRFRTPLKEPEEVGVLMVVVAVAVASASFKLQFVGILLALTTVALALQSLAARRAWRDEDEGRLVISVPARAYLAESAAIGQAVRAHLGGSRLQQLQTDAENVVVSYGYRPSRPPDVDTLRREITSRVPARIDVHLASRATR